MIEQRDPFEYTTVLSLAQALTSNAIHYSPIRRSFDKQILLLLHRMLDKVFELYFFIFYFFLFLFC
jgi:hypothetical protein